MSDGKVTRTFRMAGVKGVKPVTLDPEEVTAATTTIDCAIEALKSRGWTEPSLYDALHNIREVLAERTKEAEA